MSDTAIPTAEPEFAEPESDSTVAVAEGTTAAPVGPAAVPPPANIAKLRPEEAVSKLMEYALQLPASDLFITAGETECKVLVRSLGVLRSVTSIPPEVAKKWIAHLKVAATMDVGERRRPLDGRWVYRRPGPEKTAVDVRLSTIPTLHGEDLSMRLLDLSTAQYSLSGMGMTDAQNDELITAAANPGGLILVTGPTGSGKTATLYALLRHLNDGLRKINTIEDPIEYAIPGIRQSQVNPIIKLGFSVLLRAVLRQAPDVIMIGEIRDPETAMTAVTAANTGHLVLATIHSGAAALAPQAMIGMGVIPQTLAYSLRCVVSQRLARTLCPACKRAFPVDDMPTLFDDVAKYLEPGQGKALYAPVGCDACGHTGYTGRTGIFEVMPVRGRIRQAIVSGSPPRQVREAATEAGMLEFRQAALMKVAAGLTSTEELFRVLPAENLVGDMLDG